MHEEYEGESLHDILDDMRAVIDNHARGRVPDKDWFDGGVSMTKHWRMRLRAYLKRKSREVYARG